MKHVIIAVLLAGSIMTAGTTFAAPPGDQKIGFVDMQQAINSSNAGKEAKEQLSTRLKKYQDEINTRQEELRRLKNDLEKQGMLLSESARSSKEKDYQQKLKEFQRFTKDAQDELQAKDEELTRKILESMETIIQEYGKKHGYTFIFIKNESMLFVDEKADVTEDILKLYNANRK